jgi:hypothetical protein
MCTVPNQHAEVPIGARQRDSVPEIERALWRVT